MQYNVKIEAFEGPLDLLLHLINSMEIDIYDIPMAEISEQYMLYIQAMQVLQLDVASEYLVMAATLLAIKSKLLLPKQELDDVEQEFAYEEDPRDELVERLIEYRKYKEAAEDLRLLEEERSLVFTRPPSDLSEYSVKHDNPSSLQVSLYDMLGAFHKLMRRKKFQQPLHTKVARREITIESRMKEVLSELSKAPSARKSFLELFSYQDKEHMVVTFLAILELMKTKSIIIEQENNFADIWLTIPNFLQ
ncbi:segregation/condensation protein A [Bacillus sp. HMF5848]|uniref:segregation/condensation protein A n=1 Tax=Bacillus sp. HMF5848 TaxID=2495421 RepID=UPI000F774737|nr:segregation/condensation protein A [Bacillus sp. HMF5848]RSK27504.1 segregation/condensation protein A [Bacillus sp. HMF5848]